MRKNVRNFDKWFAEKMKNNYMSTCLLAQIQWNQSTVCCLCVIILFEIQIFSSISCLNQSKAKQSKEKRIIIEFFFVHFTFLNPDCAQFFFSSCCVLSIRFRYLIHFHNWENGTKCDMRATKRRRRKKKSKNKLERNIYKIFRWCWCHGLIQMYLHPTITLHFFFDC